MKCTQFVCLLIPVVAAAQETKPVTMASIMDAEISKAESQIVEVAAAMPEEKFNFSPENLHISGAEYNGVRTFAVLVKHTAASNYALWSPLTGEKFPKDYLGGDGPANLKTKAEIINFLKESFSLGHRAAASLNPKNMLEFDEGTKSYRLHLAVFSLTDGYDHYGQLVEYLRMNGIIQPAGRPRSK